MNASYLWRRIDIDGLVFVRLDDGGSGVSVQGFEVCAEGGEQWGARFAVSLDPAWRHRHTTVEVLDHAGTRQLELGSDDSGCWTRDGGRDPALDACTVVDLGGNPFTNAFVTCHAGLAVDGSTEVCAAFVETPALSVRPLVQRYERLAEDRWAFADDEYGRFEFTTDADGIAVNYERLARRL